MNQTNTRIRQHGFNLIEIMVAMTIGLILILGTTTLYLRSKQTADVDDSMARLQETARYALSVIETDIRMANYWGLDKNGNNLDNSNAKCDGTGFCAAEIAANLAAPSYCGGAYVTDLPRYIEGTNNQFNAALACPGNKANIGQSADSITVRRVGTSISANPLPTTLQVCSTGTGSFRVSMNTACAAGNQLHDLIMNLYYISTQSDGNNNIPSLRRVRLVAGPSTQDEEVVPGIEDMQIQFGWQNDEDPWTRAEPERYVNPGNALLNTPAGNPSGRILSVKIWLLVRSDTPDAGFTDTNTYTYADRTGAPVSNLNAPAGAARTMQYQPNDGFHRLLVSKTIFLRNAAGT